MMMTSTLEVTQILVVLMMTTKMMIQRFCMVFPFLFYLQNILQFIANSIPCISSPKEAYETI